MQYFPYHLQFDVLQPMKNRDRAQRLFNETLYVACLIAKDFLYNDQYPSCGQFCRDLQVFMIENAQTGTDREKDANNFHAFLSNQLLVIIRNQLELFAKTNKFAFPEEFNEKTIDDVIGNFHGDFDLQAYYKDNNINNWFIDVNNLIKCIQFFIKYQIFDQMSISTEKAILHDLIKFYSEHRNTILLYFYDASIPPLSFSEVALNPALKDFYLESNDIQIGHNSTNTHYFLDIPAISDYFEYGPEEKKHKYLIGYENKVSGNTSVGFIICIKENEQYDVSTQVISCGETITRIYVKQFYLLTKKYRNPFLCGSKYSIRDFKSFEAYIAGTSSPSTSKPSNQDQQLNVGSNEQNLSQNKSSKQSSHISSNSNQILGKGCQMNLRTEFFGYFLLNLLHMAPKFTVVSSEVFDQPLIVMESIPKDFSFISDHRDVRGNLSIQSLNSANLVELNSNVQLLRLFHFVFGIDDFNETNVAFYDGEIQVVDLWTSQVQASNIFIANIKGNFHSYQYDVLHELSKYSMESIIQDQLQGAAIGNNANQSLILSWLTFRALMKFQTEEISELSRCHVKDENTNQYGWLMNNTVLHFLMFKNLMSRSNQRITELGVEKYFPYINKFAKYIENVSRTCLLLFQAFSDYVISNSYESMNQDYDLLLNKFRPNVIGYKVGKNSSTKMIPDVMRAFHDSYNSDLNDINVSQMIVLTFCFDLPDEIPQECIKMFGKCDKYFIFINSMIVYDILFGFLYKNGIFKTFDEQMSFPSASSSFTCKYVL